MTEDLAKRFIDAIEAADIPALKDLYAKDAVLWSSATGMTTRASDIVAFLPAMAKRVPDRRYENRRVRAFEGGFVHQHRLTGTARDGGRAALEACAVVHVTDGKVTRVEEYCDGRQLAALFG